MKISEVREMRSDELEGKLAEKHRQLFDLRSQAMTEKLENTCAVTNAKRQIARIKTVIRENQIKGV